LIAWCFSRMSSNCLWPLTYLIDMRPPNAGLIGKQGSLSELMTPALVLDVDAFEQNISAYQQLINAHGLKARPHAKSHKCAEIARRQIAAGSVGISTATLHEAQALAEKGITNILITSPIVGRAKRERLLQLLERGIELTIVADNPKHLPSPSASHVLNVLIDIDLGMGRTGVRDIESALRLVDTVSNAKGLSWRGLQAYSGRVQHIVDFAERSTTYSAQLGLLTELILALDKRGLKPSTVSGGGTGTLAIDCREGILTEHQAGSYILMDVEYNAVTLGGDAAFATSLFLHSTVVSNNVPGQATIDAGLKSFATDGPLPKVSTGAPAGTTYTFFGDEHGRLTLPEVTYPLPIGSLVKLETPHCDPTVNLHDYLHIAQGGYADRYLEDRWTRSSLMIERDLPAHLPHPLQDERAVLIHALRPPLQRSR
jgi:D-serine deaminase-like pyridoxal phosphate-dependent protein